MILIIISSIIGILGFICGLILPFILNDIRWLLLIYMLLLVIPGLITLVNKPFEIPTKQDVIDGKAIYQETQVIIGNDTVKTYDIVWKQ